MSNLPSYSTLFTTLHDERAPIGNLGRGTHYSVLRSVEWLNVIGGRLDKPQIHDFAVIWDEDHDTRIIEVIEKIYMAGLLSPVQFIGERKGSLTVIVAAKFYFIRTSAYERLIDDISQDMEDCWPASVGGFVRDPDSLDRCATEALIQAEEHRVVTYLRNIDSLWDLGIKDYPLNQSVVVDTVHQTDSPLAQELGITQEELESLDYDIDTNESNDGGLIYNYIVNFKDGNPPEIMEQIEGVHPHGWINVSTADDDQEY